jgi:transcriptional regulator with XRE-family HTH domain
MDLRKLKDIRRIKKISIQDLSKITGISRQTISLIERGQANPTIETLETICKELNVEIKFVI